MPVVNRLLKMPAVDVVKTLNESVVKGSLEEVNALLQITPW